MIKAALILFAMVLVMIPFLAIWNQFEPELVESLPGLSVAESALWQFWPIILVVFFLVAAFYALRRRM